MTNVSPAKANGILGTRNYYKPFQYPWAYEAAQKQKHMHWTIEEIPLQTDVSDFYNKLTEEERELVTNILRFFTQADVDVASAYSEHYLPIFKLPELRMALLRFGEMEVTHMEAYSALVDTLGLPEDTFKMFMEYKAMRDKHEYLSYWGTDTLEDLAKTIAVFSAFTEGVQLFASFVMLLNFQRFNLMKGLGTIVSWSIKDESVHVETMSHIFRTLVQENPRLLNDELKFAIYSAAERVVALEDAFIDTVFENVQVKGMTPLEVKLYIRYIANNRLGELGLKSIFGQVENPFPWVDTMLGIKEHTNFFESKALEYSKAGSLTGEWSDVFK